MGQFYKGTEATFLDNAMYQAPYELMAGAIAKKDQEIQGDIDARTALGETLKAQVLDPDKPELQKLIKQYEDEIDTSVNSILNNVMSYDKTTLYSLKKRINEDWSLGKVASMQHNKKLYDDWVTAEEEKIKKDPNLYAPGLFDKIKATKMQEYSGVDYKSPGVFNTFQTEETIGVKDTLIVLEDIMKGAVPGVNHSTSWDNDRGGWRVKSNSSEKFFTPDQLQSMYKNFLETTPNYLQGIAQRQKYDMYGYENSITPEGLNTEAGSFFGSSLNLLQQKYGGKETSIGGGKIMNTVGAAKEMDKMETVYVGATLEGGKEGATYTAYAGKDSKTFNANLEKAYAGIKQSKVQAIQLLVDQSGASSYSEFIKNPDNASLIKAIEKGDFSAVKNTAAGKEIYQQYQDASYKNKVLQATKADFKRETGFDANSTDPKAQEAWNLHLDSNYITTRDTNMSWEKTGLTTKQQQKVADHVFNNGLHMNVKMTLPSGFKIKVVQNGVTSFRDIGGTQVSMNDLVKYGFYKKTPVTGGSQTGELGKQTFVYTDGTNIVNFNTDKSGVTPIWAMNDSDKMDYGIKINVQGKEVIGRISNIETGPVNEILNSQEGRRMRTERKLSKSNAVIPLGNGLTYYGKDYYQTINGKKTLLHKKGDVVGNGRTSNIKDVNTLDIISDLILSE
jgi:hypothetical protein